MTLPDHKQVFVDRLRRGVSFAVRWLTMKDVLQSLVPFLGAFIGTLGLVWTVARFPRKRLIVEVIQAVSVVDRYCDAPKMFEWEGTEVPTEEVFEVILDVKNDGNVPIQRSDFDRPLNLVFDSERVLIAEVTEEIPEGLGASVMARSHRCEASMLGRFLLE